MLENFYRDVLPESGHFCLWRKRDKAHLWAESIEELVALTERHIATPDTYFGTAAFQSDTRKQEYVSALRSLRLDIDAGEAKFAKHGPDEVYRTQRDAIAALLAFTKDNQFPPTYIVSSGAGLHVYYCFTHDVSRAQWDRLAAGLANMVAESDLKVDSSVTTDSARILRPVGALHGDGFTVTVLKRTENFYDPDELMDALPVPVALPQTRKFDTSINNDVMVQGPPSSALKVAWHCEALNHVAQMGGDVPEPYWRAMLGLVKHCTEGADLAHEWSSGSDEYDAAETQAKYDAWTTGPATCAEFGRHNPKACAGCKFNGKVKSPIMLGQLNVAEMAEAEPPKAQQATEDDEDPLSLLDPVSEPEPDEDADKPWNGNLPKGYKVRPYGSGFGLSVDMTVEVEDVHGDKVKKVVEVLFSTTVFWLGQWAEAVSTDDTAKIQVVTMSREGLRAFTLDLTLLANRTKLLEFLQGKGVATTTHKKAAELMQDYVKLQLERVRYTNRREKIEDHLGMRVLPDGELVSVHGHYMLRGDGNVERVMMPGRLESYASRFSLPLPESVTWRWGPEVWDEHINPRAKAHAAFLRKFFGKPGYEEYQLAILMALASPLMAFVTGEFTKGSELPRMSSMSVSLFSRGGGFGKTTAAQAALLAFGSPTALALDASEAGTTANARLAHLGPYGTMPSLMDEIGNAPPHAVAALLSAVANGAAKARLNRDGSPIPNAPWALINLVTTNVSQRQMIAANRGESGAIQLRLLELDVGHYQKFDAATRQEFMRAWANVTSTCAGALGAVIQRAVCQMGAVKANTLVAANVARAEQLVAEDQSARFLFRALGAVLTLAEILQAANLMPFDLEPVVQAFAKAYHSGKEFIEENSESTDSMVLLNQMLQDCSDRIIITEGEGSYGQQFGGTRYEEVLNKRVPEVIEGRHIKSLGQTEVSRSLVQQWCAEHRVPLRTLIEDAKTYGVLRTVRDVTHGQEYERSDRRCRLMRGLRDADGRRTLCFVFHIPTLNTVIGGEGAVPEERKVIEMFPDKSQ